MAIDTRQKRMSAINVASPWRGPMIVPTGSDSQAKRQAADFMYSGILAAGLALTDGMHFTNIASAAPAFTNISSSRPQFSNIASAVPAFTNIASN